MLTQPHPPPHRVPPATLLIANGDPQPRRRRTLRRGLIAVIREIDTPRTPARPVPARTTRERSCFPLVELVEICLGWADGVGARGEWEVGWDADFADFAAGDVEQFCGDRGGRGAELNAGTEVGLRGGTEFVWVNGVVRRIWGGAGDGEGNRVVVCEGQVKVVWRCLRGSVLRY